MAKLPDILIVGAAKGGTTSLQTGLADHPDVCAPRSPDDGQPVKEIHFFDHCWGRGQDWYEAHFPDDGHGLDATPNYLALLSTHRRMQAIVPAARLLITLRDPVERAYSQYNHYRQELPRSASWDDWRKPRASFAENINPELQEIESAVDPAHRFRGLVGKGCYAAQIEHLLRFYPRAQMHVMILERWARDPAGARAEVLRFLGLRPFPLPLHARHRRRYNAPMDPGVRAKLRAFYRPHNERLFDLLGYEIGEWQVDRPEKNRDHG